MSETVLLTMSPKLPDEDLDYAVDFAGRLLTGETLTNKGASTTRGSAVVHDVNIVGTKVVFWLRGGVALEDTLVKVSAVTSSTPARTHEVLVRVRIASPGS